MFPRALLDRLGTVPAGGYFDWSIALAARLNDLPLTYLDEPLVAYRRHPAAVTAARRQRRRPSDKLGRQWALRWAMLGGSLEGVAAPPAGVPNPVAFQTVLKTWLNAWFSAAMVRALMPHRHAVFPDAKPIDRYFSVLGLFWGYRLRSWVAPRRYLAIRRIGHDIEFAPASRESAMP